MKRLYIYKIEHWTKKKNENWIKTEWYGKDELQAKTILINSLNKENGKSIKKIGFKAGLLQNFTIYKKSELWTNGEEKEEKWKVERTQKYIDLFEEDENEIF